MSFYFLLLPITVCIRIVAVRGLHTCKLHKSWSGLQPLNLLLNRLLFLYIVVCPCFINFLIYISICHLSLKVQIQLHHNPLNYFDKMGLYELYFQVLFYPWFEIILFLQFLGFSVLTLENYLTHIVLLKTQHDYLWYFISQWYNKHSQIILIQILFCGFYCRIKIIQCS